MGSLAIEVDLDRMKIQPRVVIYGAGEFLDVLPGETRWVIPGLIPQGVPAVLASKGGLGKSYLALQLCIALATGKPFLTFEAQSPMGAVYFNLEDPENTVQRRFRAIVEDYRQAGEWSDQDEANVRKNFAAMFPNWNSKDCSTYLPDVMPNLEWFTRLAEERKIKPGLMVLDTLARFSQGDENTVQALRPVLTACNKIAHLGWTPLMLHHVGKGQDGARTAKAKDKPSLGDRMSTEWVRGSSAIVDNFRCILQLAAIREDEAERAQMDPDKARQGGYLVLGATKLNGGQKAEWSLLEQNEHGGWYAPQDAMETLAALRGAKAVASLHAMEAILVDLYQATRHGMEPDRKMLAKKHCSGAKDPAHALRLQINKLVHAGLLQKKTDRLTEKGFRHVKETGQETVRTTDDD